MVPALDKQALDPSRVVDLGPRRRRVVEQERGCLSRLRRVEEEGRGICLVRLDRRCRLLVSEERKIVRRNLELEEGEVENEVVEQEEREEGVRVGCSKGREGSLEGPGGKRRVDRRRQSARRQPGRVDSVEVGRSEGPKGEVGREEGSERQWRVERPKSTEGGKACRLEGRVCREKRKISCVSRRADAVRSKKRETHLPKLS